MGPGSAVRPDPRVAAWQQSPLLDMQQNQNQYESPGHHTPPPGGGGRGTQNRGQKKEAKGAACRAHDLTKGDSGGHLFEKQKQGNLFDGDKKKGKASRAADRPWGMITNKAILRAVGTHPPVHCAQAPAQNEPKGPIVGGPLKGGHFTKEEGHKIFQVNVSH